jgi:hypothetical protein
LFLNKKLIILLYKLKKVYLANLNKKI